MDRASLASGDLELILSGSQIAAAREQGHIVIDPFDSKDINPNSYNYRLGSELMEWIPTNEGTSLERLTLPSDGFVLQPRRLYLGSTYERIGSSSYVITLSGRSSLGRLGLFLNATADLGHIGCESHWTLELSVVQPLRIYPGMRIGQIAFWKLTKTNYEVYRGRYLSDRDPTPNKDPTLEPAISTRRYS